MSEANGYADKAALLGANKRRFADVVIADVGTFRIRSLTERERSEYEAGFLDRSGKARTSKLVEAKVRLIVLCLCNAEGLQLLSDGDAAGLGGIDSTVSNKLFDECQTHCGFSEADVEDLVKN